MGTSGLIFHRDATGYWRKPGETIGYYAHYTGIWGSGPADVFTTDRSGAIRHFDGTSWSAMYSGSTPLNAVWGSSPTDVYAVGDDGVVLHYDGTSWTTVIGG